MKNKNRIAAAAIGIAALALTACAGSGEQTSTETGDSQELTTLNVMTMGLTFDGAFFGGIEQGFFEEEGLHIETSIMANPPAGLAAAQSGQVDIAYAPIIPVMIAMNEGVEVQIVAPGNGLPEDAINAENPEEFEDAGLFVHGNSGIESLADLEGKTIAVPARKAVMEIVSAVELEEAGVSSDDINWVVLDLASAVSALEQGTIDAAGLVTPFTAQARETGSVKLSSPTIAFYEEGPMAYWVAGPNTIADKEEAIQAFQRAMAKSNAWATENPEEAIAVGIEQTDSQLDVADIGTPVWPSDIVLDDLKRVNTKLAQYGYLPAELDLDGFVYVGSTP